MTPEERAHAWVGEAYLCEHGERNEFRHNYECEVCVANLLLGAALRERDAEHEIALKKALDACECDACYGISPVECDSEKMAARLRALLEEAGK